MELPLVSIIVPVYNAQSHLSRCLESICGQEYKNLELIVINDGSKDKSLPVCEEFRKKDSRILLVDKANSGVSDTRNLGLKLAGGKYVQFVDSDDYIAPDYTARLVEAAEKTDADLVISPYTMVIPAGASKPEQVLEKIQDGLGVIDDGQIGAFRFVDMRIRVGEQHRESVGLVRERDAARHIHGDFAFFGIYRHDGEIAHAHGQFLHVVGGRHIGDDHGEFRAADT